MIEKVLDVTGLYINPPDHAIVLCADQRSRIQALDRTRPKVPLDLGGAEGSTHGDLRDGTMTLCSALEVAAGEGVAKREARHRGFLTFLRLIDKEMPKDLDLNLLLANHGTNQYAAVEAWLAERPRYHLHFTPTHSSWLNEVERWFGLLGEKALKCGGSRSVREVVGQSQALTAGRNSVEKSFAWVAAAQSILARSERSSTSI